MVKEELQQGGGPLKVLGELGVQLEACVQELEEDGGALLVPAESTGDARAETLGKLVAKGEPFLLQQHLQ